MAASNHIDVRTVGTAASALALAARLLAGLVILAQAGGAVLVFLLLSVLPTVLGFAGLSRMGALPWGPPPVRRPVGRMSSWRS